MIGTSRLDVECIDGGIRHLTARAKILDGDDARDALFEVQDILLVCVEAVIDPDVGAVVRNDAVDLRIVMNDNIGEQGLLHLPQPLHRTLVQNQQDIMLHHEAVCHRQAVVDMSQPEFRIAVHTKHNPLAPQSMLGEKPVVRCTQLDALILIRFKDRDALSNAAVRRHERAPRDEERPGLKVLWAEVLSIPALTVKRNDFPVPLFPKKARLVHNTENSVPCTRKEIIQPLCKGLGTQERRGRLKRDDEIVCGACACFHRTGRMMDNRIDGHIVPRQCRGTEHNRSPVLLC